MKARMLLTGLLVCLPVLPAAAQDAGTRPPVEIVVLPGEASAVPFKRGVAYANGGVIDVTQPNPGTLVVTLSGLTATNADLLCTSVASYSFQLAQCIEVRFNSARVKGAQLTLEGRVIGLLRTNHEIYNRCCFTKYKKCPEAHTDPALAALSAGGQDIVAVNLPPRQASNCEDLSVYNHEGPLTVPVAAGKYTLHGTWGFGTTHPCFCCRGASAEFSPQSYEVPGAYWLSEFRPFNGLATKDFGFQITVKVIPEFKALDDKSDETPLPKKEEPTPKKEEGKEKSE